MANSAQRLVSRACMLRNISFVLGVRGCHLVSAVLGAERHALCDDSSFDVIDALRARALPLLAYTY